LSLEAPKKKRAGAKVKTKGGFPEKRPRSPRRKRGSQVKPKGRGPKKKARKRLSKNRGGKGVRFPSGGVLYI